MVLCCGLTKRDLCNHICQFEVSSVCALTKGKMRSEGMTYLQPLARLFHLRRLHGRFQWHLICWLAADLDVLASLHFFPSIIQVVLSSLATCKTIMGRRMCPTFPNSKRNYVLFKLEFSSHALIFTHFQILFCSRW
jgi:hypothetical protein